MAGPTAPAKRFSDDFYLYTFKIAPCKAEYPHNWSVCPFAHPNEHARRRDPRIYKYDPVPCPHDRKGYNCPEGEKCPGTHNVYEYHLHPKRFRTQMCQQGAACTRPLCFFAHDMQELRVASTSAEPNAGATADAGSSAGPSHAASGPAGTSAAAHTAAQQDAAVTTSRQAGPTTPENALHSSITHGRHAEAQSQPGSGHLQQQLQQPGQQQCVQPPQPYVSPVTSSGISLLQSWQSHSEDATASMPSAHRQRAEPEMQQQQFQLQQQENQEQLRVETDATSASQVDSGASASTAAGTEGAAAVAIASNATAAAPPATSAADTQLSQVLLQQMQQLQHQHVQQLQHQLEHLLMQGRLYMNPTMGSFGTPAYQEPLQYSLQQQHQQQLLQQLGMLQLQAEQQQHQQHQQQQQQQRLHPDGMVPPMYAQQPMVQQFYPQHAPQPDAQLASYFPMYGFGGMQQQQPQAAQHPMWPTGMLDATMLQQQQQQQQQQMISAAAAAPSMPTASAGLQPSSSSQTPLQQQSWNALPSQSIKPIGSGTTQQQPPHAMLMSSGAQSGNTSSSVSSNANALPPQLAISQDATSMGQSRGFISPSVSSSNSTNNNASQFGLWGSRAWGP